MCRFRNITFLLVLLAFQVNGQFKNNKLDESDSKQAFEPSIAINRKDPKNIVVTSASNNIYYSVDGGLSWKKTKIDYSTGVSGDMIVIAGGKDSFYLFHRTTQAGADHLVCHESSDKGETWNEGVLIDDEKDRMSNDQRWQRVTTDSKGNLHATWTQSDKYASADTACRSNIFYSQSSNGKKWSTPIRLSTFGGKCAGDDFTAAGSSSGVSVDDKVYAIWADNGKIFFDRSFNGGDLWLSSDLPVTDQPGGWAFKVRGHGQLNGLPQLAVDHSKSPLSGTLYVCWSDQRNGVEDTDVWFIRSNNGGDNWTSPVKVLNNDSGRQQYCPSMAIDQTTGIIYVLYYNRPKAEDADTDVYLSYSIDGGTKFESVKISESSFTPSEDVNIGDYIGLAAHKGIITPVWTRVEDGKTSIWTTTIKQDELVKQPEKK